MQRLESQNEAAIDGCVSWAQGYISGFNYTDNEKKGIIIEYGALIIWLIDYSGANPTKYYYEALQEVIDQHAR
ncbi:MAG: hypothetical protein L0Z68_08240 [Gammaproteobacteria bacterium]|nr:hypothetical protein [Gammaproteobacteria bacterium]